MASTGQRDALVREVFTFASSDSYLYGSFYATAQPTPTFGVVVCPAWGAEARTGERLCRSFAREVAARGGAAMIFDWPGQGESGGDPQAVELDDLIRATDDAARQLGRRFEPGVLGLAGFRLGASIATLCAAQVSASSLALLQPVWDPEAHFASVEKASKRAALGAEVASGWAFGFPLPAATSFAGAGTRMAEALQRLSGPRAVLGYGLDEQPLHLDSIDLEGDWKQAAAANDKQLGERAAQWLAESVEQT